MNITWPGHACFLIEDGETRVVIDPFVSGNPVFPRVQKAALDKLTHILVTHAHGDHLGDTIALPSETGRRDGGLKTPHLASR